MIVTISRQTGSLGNEIALLLSQALNIQLITHEEAMRHWLPSVADNHTLKMLSESPKHYHIQSQQGFTYMQFLEQKLKEASEKSPVIVLGLAAQAIFKDDPNAIKVRIISSDQVRKNRIMDQFGLGDAEAERLLILSDRRHKRYLYTLYGLDWSEPTLYDLCLNTDSLNAEQACDLLQALITLKNKQNPSQNQCIPSTPAKHSIFRHPSEEEFSKILDMYHIEWAYEPKTFPIEWNAEGGVKMAFSPDFYLPRFKTYIEITTMDQKYTTEKKRKVKRLKELYPGINITLVFKRDFHTLLKRFSLLRGVDEQ